MKPYLVWSSVHLGFNNYWMSQHWLNSQEVVPTVGNNFPFLGGESPGRHHLCSFKSETCSVPPPWQPLVISSHVLLSVDDTTSL